MTVFTGKRAVVTGAAGGIGTEVVRLLLSAGATVIASDIKQESLSALKEEGAVAIVCDVVVPEDRRRLAEAAGRVHYLVNCHGTIGLTRLEDATPHEWDQIDGVNAKGTFFLLQAFMRRMESGGAIVNMSSAAGKMAMTVEAAIYNCSKASVIAMTKTFAYAMAPAGVRVNCVCAGDIDTGMQDRVVEALSGLRDTSPTELVARRLAVTPLARVGESREVASVIAFLLSDAASYMTGQAVNVTGGLTMY